jgi:hypothetical protein
VLRLVLRSQGAYYFLTGLWPLVSLKSFVFVTGPKTDEWLVYMVGLLAASIGLTLWVGADSLQGARALAALAVATPISFAAIDLRYALTGRIAPVYLLDAAVEIGFLAALLVGWLGARQSLTTRHR